MYLWEQALIHDPALHVEVQVILECIVQFIHPRGILRQQDQYRQLGHPHLGHYRSRGHWGTRSPGNAIQERVFALTQPEEDVSNAVVEGIILLYNSWA